MMVVFRALLEKKAAGIFHVTNPGGLKHREIMALYRELVDHSHTNEWVSEADLLLMGLAQKTRSNTILQSPNLAKLGITMPEAHQSLYCVLSDYAKNKHTL